MTINTVSNYNQTSVYNPNLHMPAAKFPAYPVASRQECVEYPPSFTQASWQQQQQHQQQQQNQQSQQGQQGQSNRFGPTEFHQPTRMYSQQQHQVSQNYLLNSAKPSPVNPVPSPYLQHTRSPISSYSSSASSSFSSTATTPPLNTSSVTPTCKLTFKPLNIKHEDRQREQPKTKWQDQIYMPSSSSSSSVISTPLSAPPSTSSFPFSSASSPLNSLALNKVVKPVSRSKLKNNVNLNAVSKLSLAPVSATGVQNLPNLPTNEQSQIPPDVYVPSDPSLDISSFTEEDIIILKNLLASAEIHKWKYISNRMSKTRSKKLNAEYCINKFHTMYGLPFSPKNSLLHSNYFLKIDKERKPEEENFEGILGSSIPYIVSKDGWNLIDA